MGIPSTLSQVPAQTPYIQYVATSGQTVFPYPFVITQDSDLVVVDNGTTLGTDSGYSVSAVGNPSGGSVTFAVGRASGEIITLYRDIPIQRLTQISQNGGFASTAFNAEYNNIYLLLQQLQTSIDQCLQIPNTNNPAPTTSLTPGAYASKYLAFDASGNPTPAELTSSGTVTSALIAGLLNGYEAAPILPPYVQTAAEGALGVTPTNYAYPPYTLMRYGADPTGGTDSTTALQTACNCAAQANYATVRVGTPAAKLKISGAWTINLNACGIDFEGAFVDASGFTGTNWCTPTQTASINVNARALYNKAHPVRNATWSGNNSATSYALYLNEAVNDSIASCVFQNITFRNWPQDVYFGAGAFEETFIACTFATSDIAFVQTQYSITQSNATNGGERQTFISCEWYNKDLLISCAGGGSEIYLIGCSVDYFNEAFNITGGSVYMIGGHMEAASDAAYWGSVTQTNASLHLNAVGIAVTGNKSVYDIFYSDSSVTNGGVFLTDCHFGPGSSVLSVRLVGGTGNASVAGLQQDNGGSKLTAAASLNRLAYGDFESANYTAEWTLTGGATRSSSQKHGGAYSLSFPSVSGTNAEGVAKFSCKPGQYIQGEFWYLFPSITSGTYTIEAYYVDAGNNALGSATIFVQTSAAVNAWTKQNFAIATPAPAGTVGVWLQALVSSVSSGTQTGYLDDVIVNVL